MRIAATAAAFLLVTCAFTSMTIRAAPDNTIEELRESFLHPPDDARIMMRWWWFGPTVQKSEIDRELHVMKDAGIGGVEIQPVYPVQLDDRQTPNHLMPYLSPQFLSAIHNAATTARSLGLRVDVTLGSGWPYGGPHTPISEAAGRLRVEQVAVPEGTRTVPIPALEQGETLIGAFLGGAQMSAIEQGRVQVPAGLSGSDLLTFFIASRTGQQVKRAAVGAEGYVLDHYDRAAIEDHLASVANPLLEVFGDHPPYAVFSDSLEVYESDWTPNFLVEFQKRRGYDLTPYLPALVNDIGTNTRAIRHDWAKTLTELAEDNYLAPIHQWAHAHHTLFRSQTYGEPPVILSSNKFVDLPEGEHGPYWRRFSAARWASSASHLYGHPITSAETWTWLHSPSFRATPLDLKAEADRHFIQGINQLIGHGWPYSPPGEQEPGWRFYAAAALNDHNPWFDVMPDLTSYLQRVSFLLRQGKPANDVAIYVPTDDVWARARLGKVTVDETSDELLGPVLIPAVLNAGYNFDFIDDRAIAEVGTPYKVLILAGIERMPLVTLQRLQSFVNGGGKVIATRSLPSLGPGFLEAESETTRIRELARHLFREGATNTRFVSSDAAVADALHDFLAPDFFAIEPTAAPALGFFHRQIAGTNIYFIANASNHPVTTAASLRIAGSPPQWWNAFTGAVEPASFEVVDGRTFLTLTLAPYESRILVFDKSFARVPARVISQNWGTTDLTYPWKVTLLGTGQTINMPHLRSWTDDESTRFYSGRAQYETTIDIHSSFFTNHTKFTLDFGPGTPAEPALQETPGMHALLDSPVRESAVVTINGKRAGLVWHPPYELDVTPFVHVGANQLQIVVGNTAINELAGRSPADYKLLNLRYGERFQPQDMNNLHPLPSGILHTVTLKAE